MNGHTFLWYHDVMPHEVAPTRKVDGVAIYIISLKREIPPEGSIGEKVTETTLDQMYQTLESVKQLQEQIEGLSSDVSHFRV